MEVNLSGDYADIWTKFRVFIFRDDKEFEVLVHFHHMPVNVDECLAPFHCILSLYNRVNYQVYLLCNVFDEDFFAKLD
jgi:hypothetical protein